MASTQRSKPPRRPTVAAIARKAGNAAKGSVKTSRSATAKAVKAKPARSAAPRTKVAAKARAKTAPARTVKVKTGRGGLTKVAARTRTPTARGSARDRAIGTRTPAAKKIAAKKPAARTASARKAAPRPLKPTSPKQATAKTAAARTSSAKPLPPKRLAPKSLGKSPGLKLAVKRPAASKAAAKPAAPSSRSPAPIAAAQTPAPETRLPAPQTAVDLAAREKELAREHSTTAVNRALSLLETLARTGPVPLAVLADAAGCGKTAALQLLSTMQGRNFVIQDASHSLWQLGARWAVLGSAASEQGALAATSMPFLAALGNATGENVYLRVREGMECETVAIYQTDPGLRVYTEVGKKMPLHAGSGRMLLAHAPEAVQTQVLAQRLQRYTPSTRIDPSWIAADLHRIRQRGFLITDSEVVAGTVSVCAAVRDASGQVVAAILIGAPSLRMRPPRPRALMPLVVEAARKLSHALGSISEQPAAAPQSEPMIEQRRMGTVAGPAWPAQALGAAISRPHSIFR